MVAADATVIGIGVVLFVAAVALLIVSRLRQPMVLGYLVAGLLVGPHGPLPWQLIGLEHVEAMASLAIVFIMLYIGLEFSPRKLKELGAAPLVVALVQMLVMFLVGRGTARLLGMDPMASLFVGMALAISSTIVAIKLLEEKGELASLHGRLVVGVLLVEDVVAVIFLALIGGLAVSGQFELGAVTPVFLGLVAFAVAALVIGALVVPRILEAAHGSRELLLILILGIAFGVALLADHFHFSIALGAFLVGSVIAESRVAREAEGIIEPLKFMFTAVFFVTIGMLIDPRELIASWRLVLGISGILIVVRIIGIAVPSFLFGYPAPNAVRGGAALGQIGEFSFIVLASGIAAGLIGSELLTLFVGVAGVTTLATPYAMWAAPRLQRALGKVTPRPLHTFAEFYTGWVQRLGDAEETKRHRSREWILVRRIILNLTILVALGAIAYVVSLMLGARVVDLSFARIPTAWLAIAMLGILMVPFVFTVLLALREVAMEIVLELVPDRVVSQEEPPVALKVVKASLGLVLAIGVAGVVVLFLPEQGPGVLAVGLGVAVLVVVAAAIFWRRIQGLHEHVETAVEDLFGVARTVEERDEVMRLIGRHYTVSLGTETVEVPSGSPAAHRQIRDAEIRARTGATVVSVARGKDRWMNPPASLILLPGDRLLLMGETHHLEKARRFIASRAAPPRAALAPSGEVTVREHVLAGDAKAHGRTIAGLALRERTGAMIVAVLRDGEHIQNPPPNLVLQRGDRVFLIGTDVQVDAGVSLLTQRGEPEGSAASGPAQAPDA